MAQRSTVRALVVTGAGLMIALSIASLRRHWQEADATIAARAVIRQQLAAFRENDYSAAYRHAAPEIQEQFAVAEFRRMVRDGYPQLAHSRTISFGDARMHGE